MRHWSQLATRNWRAKPSRTLGAVLAIALGAAAVVWVTCCYESIRQTIMRWSSDYVGNAHIMVTSPLGKYDQIPERLVDSLADVPNVKHVTPTLVQRLRSLAVRRDQRAAFEAPRGSTPEMLEVDLLGVRMPGELDMRDHRKDIRAGRMLTTDDKFACVLEQSHAEDVGVGVGDLLLIYTDTREGPVELEIVGLVARRRVTRFQKALALMPLATLQEIRSKQALVTTVDVELLSDDRADVQRATAEIRKRVRPVARNASIRSVDMRIKQIEAAQSQQQFVLVLLSCVAMLTALFIILSTLSMGMVERIGQLGLMRCVGVTRAQLAALVMIEVLPLGAVGIAAGIPIGLGLTALTVVLVPDYVGSFAVSWSGIALAAGAGIVTTFVAGLLPALAVLRVSPLEAARPRAGSARPGLLAVVSAVAALILVVQHFAVLQMVSRSPSFVEIASLGVVCLYVGYALVAPFAVRWIGAPATVFAAAILGVRTRLLQDQVGYAIWRASGVCCGLMVGLSLLVGIFVVNESVVGGWQFPKAFPEAYVWSLQQMTPRAKELVASIPHIREYTVANAVNVHVEERPIFMAEVWASVTWFLAIDPDSFFNLTKFEFVEGEPEAAKQMLREGGHVIVADDFARSRNKHLGDSVRVFYGSQQRTFKIAGVIISPAIDIAAGYFQAHTEYNVAATGSVIGTNDDLRSSFGVNGCRMVLMNLDLPPEPVPPNWPPPRDSKERLPAEYYEPRVPREELWLRWREEQVLKQVQARLEEPNSFAGTVRALKDEIDRELTRMTRLMTAVPGVALLVAALGVANLMTANVTARAKQIAILRAVGATRGLVLRIVIGEAIVLGLLGSALGLMLGVHLGSDITALVERMWGFKVTLRLPWEYLSLASGMTIVLCIVAGVLPARHAARTNVVDALHVS